MVFYESERVDKSEQEKVRILCFVFTVNLMYMFKNDKMYFEEIGI